jgi:rRNA maturation endonuclease Nob1
VFRLQCRCEKVLEVPESLANQKIKCKHCGRVLSVPPPPKRTEAGTWANEASPFHIHGYRPCPGCGKAYPTDEKVCLACGMEIDSGALIYASVEESAERNPKDGRSRGFLRRVLDLFRGRV